MLASSHERCYVACALNSTPRTEGNTTMSTSTATLVPAGTWQLDPVHSSIGFAVGYLAGTFRGSFREFEGRLVSGSDGVRLEGVAKVPSVDVKDENLNVHLQSPDFFDAERFAELRFSGEVVPA